MKFRVVHSDVGFLLQRRWLFFWICACFEDSLDRRNYRTLGSHRYYFESLEKAEKWAHNMYPAYRKFRYVLKVFEVK
jgi:thiosulfate reductase cytochrome b subunit